jgi:hypothetical protein
VIGFATDYVEKHARVSQKDKEKQVTKTEEHHLARRFHLPIMGVAAIILLLLVVFFFMGIGKEETKEAPERIDFVLYENLGILPQEGKVAGGTQIYSRDEIVEKIRAEAFINERKNNPLLANLKASDAVSGFQKKATTYNIVKAGMEQRTLVEIRFKVERDTDSLKIVEAIPKSIAASSDEIILTKGGVIAEKDPVIIFTFNNAKKGDIPKAVYVINTQISTLDTMTFPAEESKESMIPAQPLVCGDGRCVEGESYLSCCTDCGCSAGFVCENNNCVTAAKDECQTNTQCDDGDAATIDSCTGRPKTCQHTAITECIEGDGQCPAGCITETDTDCPPTITPPAIAETPANQTPNITGEQESPDILNITITPEEAAIGEEIMFEARVVDANGKDDIAKVWLEVMELAQSHGETGEMFDDGAEGDKMAGDGIYTAVGVISDYYIAGTYHLNVFAQDSAGNKKKSQKTFRVTG